MRVEKSSGTLYWRAYTGQVTEETDTSGNEIRSYFFFAGRRVAWRGSLGNVYYYFADALGSVRAVMDATGSVCFRADNYPYGQENDYSTSCSPTYKFTGYEYDSETGNYYGYARYYDPRLERFMSPDPLGGNILDPQSLDCYTYVLDKLEGFIDPSGESGQRAFQIGFGMGMWCVTSRYSDNPKDAAEFFGEATGPDGGSVMWWKPRPDAFLFGLAQKLEK